MVKKTISITALLLAAIQPGFAANGCNPCEPAPCYERVEPCVPEFQTCYEVCDPCSDDYDCCGGLPGRVGVSLDFLWWKACINNLDYAISYNGNIAAIPNSLEGEYQYVGHGWSPGLRAGVYVEDVFCNLDFSFFYTWMHDTHSASAIGSPPVPPTTPPSVQPTLFLEFPNIVIAPATSTNLFWVGIAAKHNYRYQTFEGLFSGEYQLNCCSNLNPFFGAIALKLDQVMESSTIPALTPEQIAALGPYLPVYQVRWDSTYEAAGLKIGSDFLYKLCPDINFTASAAAMVVAGFDHWDYEGRAYPTSLIVSGVPSPPFFTTEFNAKTHERHMVCSPGVHLKAGFSSTTKLLGPETSIYIGYEFVNWWNTPMGKPIQNGFLDGGSRFGLHGLYTGLSIKM